jgi:protein TonB
MDYAQQQRDPTQHLAGLMIVILLHGLIVYALVTGLARKVVDVIKKPIETRLVEEAKPPPPPEAPPPPPKLSPPPPPFIPPPEVQIAITPPPASTITAVTPTPPPPAAMTPVAVARIPARVAPVIDAARNCAKPEYPPSSARAEETGTVALRFWIDEEGHAVKSEVVRSSGHKRLDEAARQALSLCRFKPGTLDGKPVLMTGDIQYVWKLE